MTESLKVAIVAAIEREVWPLVKGWRRSLRDLDGRAFQFFEAEGKVLICGGIGSEHARRATEAIIRLYAPAMLISAGFAGALQPDVRVGQVLVPRVVIDVGDGSRIDTGTGTGILATFGAIADAAQKAKLARAFGAQAVDMEAAAVARGAEAHGLRFMACKAISDASDFSMPCLGAFTGSNGKFQAGKFAFYAGLRPWLWKSTAQLAKGSALASRELCKSLTALIDRNTEWMVAGREAVGAQS